jgi:hypothetical protein
VYISHKDSKWVKVVVDLLKVKQIAMTLTSFSFSLLASCKHAKATITWFLETLSPTKTKLAAKTRMRVIPK